MRYFSMPADFKKETIDEYYKLNSKYNDSKVFETYGQVTIGSRVESGRPLDKLPEISIKNLEEYITYCSERDIKFNYTINAPTIQNREFTQNGIKDFLRFLDEIYCAGVRSLTIALPSLIELVKLTKYNFEIKASAICQINTVEKAKNFKKFGVNRIVLDESLNREFGTMKRIREECGEEVEIIVNSICAKNCSNRIFHYNQIAADSLADVNEISVDYYAHRCMLKRCENPSNILRLTWIRPEDIKYYEAIGVNRYKIQGRNSVLKGDPVRTLECYMRGSYDGNLMDLIELFNNQNSFSPNIDNKKLDGFIKPFYEKKDFCKNDCGACNYCNNFAQKCMSIQQVSETNKIATEFYNEYDKYINLVKKLTNDEENNISEENFDFNL
ncbi:U32 family peptidase [Clostridium felsineum]|uniref:U32 family peptidase n=1 Tax=Clostridium felsineum TaxID=36839 RepID=UPI00214D979C|nr:U32 family peptidase [Clostridium felsineum]